MLFLCPLSAEYNKEIKNGVKSYYRVHSKEIVSLSNLQFEILMKKILYVFIYICIYVYSTQPQ